MKKMKLLIADDDRAARKMLRARLSSWGYSVVEAADGLGVVSQCLRQRPAAIILDDAMPNGDGQSVAKLIRRESDVPIVFLSGYSAERFRRTVIALPEVFYFHKPLDAPKLKKLLEATLGHNERRWASR